MTSSSDLPLMGQRSKKIKISSNGKNNNVNMMGKDRHSKSVHIDLVVRPPGEGSNVKEGHRMTARGGTVRPRPGSDLSQV